MSENKAWIQAITVSQSEPKIQRLVLKVSEQARPSVTVVLHSLSGNKVYFL